MYWTHLKGSKLPATVLDLIIAARAKGVNASTVAIETYDSMMTRLWRNIENKTKEMDDKVVFEYKNVKPFKRVPKWASEYATLYPAIIANLKFE